MKWRYFTSKEGLIVILWYIIIESSQSLIPYTSIKAVSDTVLYTVFFLYPLFGMIADIWIGRFRVMTLGTWIAWTGAISVAIYTASIAFYQNTVLVTMLNSVEHVGIGIFQANALQFGVDQLHDASSEQLSSFVYWYIWSQEIASEVQGWIKVGMTRLLPDQANLVQILLIVMLLSFMLFAIPCFLKKCFAQPPVTSNPYTLIWQVLAFAFKHKYPLRRSAFTFWEEQKPSRFEQGESKYGGPFTHEQIEDFKAFFRIVKLLLLLTGILICRNGFSIINIGFNSSKTQRLRMNGIVTVGVFISLPLHELIIYPCFRAKYPGALTRTSIGIMSTLLVLTIILLYDAAGQILNGVSSSDSQYVLSLDPWYNLPTWLCGTISYLILTTSVLEFIVAQSPYSMRGMLIGIYYCIGYGLSQAAAWILYLPFQGQNYSASLRNDTIYLSLMTAIGILSASTFVYSAQMYKYREREEVVETHRFAEQYYEKQESTT